MPLSVPLVLDPGSTPGRLYTVHLHRTFWRGDALAEPRTGDHLAKLEADARLGLRLVSECVAAELADAAVEVIQQFVGAEAVARVLCDAEPCAAVAARYKRDADEDREAEDARDWAATQLPHQAVHLAARTPGPRSGTTRAEDLLAAVLAAQPQRAGSTPDTIVLQVGELAELFARVRGDSLFHDLTPAEVRTEMHRLIQQSCTPHPTERQSQNTADGDLGLTAELDAPATAETKEQQEQ